VIVSTNISYILNEPRSSHFSRGHENESAGVSFNVVHARQTICFIRVSRVTLPQSPHGFRDIETVDVFARNRHARVIDMLQDTQHTH